jgi:hypothetical protein
VIVLPSNIPLVGVITVDTSETESFRIVKWVGEFAGDEDLSDFGTASPSRIVLSSAMRE